MVWNYELSDNVTLPYLPGVEVVDVDMFGTSAETVAALHAAGLHVIAYVNCGAYENWRPDAAAFPADILGKPLQGWPGERWLDVRSAQLRPLLQKRFDIAASRGFDAVDCDNVDGFTQDSGFAISAADQIAFNRWFAAEVHTRGMAIGLKNDVDQAAALVDSFDFAVNEQCNQYLECGKLAATFARANKAIFGVEYHLQPSSFCGADDILQLNFIRKDLDLARCPLYSCAINSTIC